MKRLLLIIILSVLCSQSYALSQKSKQERIDSLLIELPNAIEDSNKVNLLIDLSLLYTQIDPKIGLRYAKESANIAKKISWEIGEADAYTKIGINCSKLRLRDEGLSAFKKALEINKIIGNQTSIALAHDNIGIFHRVYSEYDQALLYHKNALSIYTEVKDTFGMANSYQNIAIVLTIQADYANALDYYYKALKTFEKTADKSKLAYLHNSLGIFYNGQGQLEKALEHYNNALLLFVEIKDDWGLSSVYSNMGNIFQIQAKYDKSLEYYLKSLELAKASNDKRGVAISLGNIADVYSSKLEYKQAMYYYFKSLKIKIEIQDIRAQVYTLSGIADLYHVLSQDSVLKSIKSSSKYISLNPGTNLNSSIKYFEKSLSLSKEVNMRNKVQASLKYLADIYSEKGDYKKSLNYYQQHIAVKDSIYNDVSKTKLLEIETKRESDLHHAEIKTLNEKNKYESQQKKIILYFSLFGIILLITLLFVLYKKYKFKTKAEVLLQEKNKEILERSQALENTLSQLKSTQAQLIESEKTASVGILISGVAHEINNPLNYIQGGLYAITTYFDKHLTEHKPKVLPMLNGITVGLERAANIVKGLNRINREDDSKTEKCDLHSIIDNCLMVLHNKLEHRIDINKQYCSKELLILGNEGKLHQIFLSILLNSIQAIENSGTITIESKIYDNSLSISIIDDGYGISEDNLSKIALPFFTTKAPGKGSGLGMSITYKLIEEYKGTIAYESEIGKGTKVIIILPTNKTGNNF